MNRHRQSREQNASNKKMWIFGDVVHVHSIRSTDLRWAKKIAEVSEYPPHRGRRRTATIREHWSGPWHAGISQDVHDMIHFVDDRYSITLTNQTWSLPVNVISADAGDSRNSQHLNDVRQKTRRDFLISLSDRHQKVGWCCRW
jgi:hypothetical protein